MKKNKLIKKIFYSSLSLSVLSIGSLSAVSAFLNKDNANVQNNYNYSRTLNDDTVERRLNSNNNESTKNNQRLISFNRSGDNGTDFSDELAKQYKATDSSGTSYAILTTSQNGTDAGAKTTAKHDGITKYNLTGTDAGKADWLVKFSDLQALTNSGSASESTQAQTTSLNITSIKYSSGQFGTNGSLFVLGNDGSNSYLFRIVWGGTDKGKYELVAKTNDSKVYKYINITSQTSNSVVLFGDISSNNVDYATVSVGTAQNAKQETLTKKTIDLSATTSNLPKNLIIQDTLYYNGDNYLVVKQKKNGTSTGAKEANNGYSINKDDVLNSLVKINLSSSGDSISVPLSNVLPTKVTQEFIDKGLVGNDIKGLQVTTTLVNSNLTLITSFEGTKINKSNGFPYVISSVSLSNNYNLNTNLATNYNSNNNSFTIDQVSPMYSNSAIVGYIALDSLNRAYKLDNNFQPLELLYEFDSTGTGAGKTTKNKVFNINTYPSVADWYAQSDDSKIGDFFNNTLIGELGSGSSNYSEVLATFSFKTDSSVTGLAKYVKASDNGTIASTELTSFLNSTDAYKNYMNISSYDPRFGEPKISVSSSTITKINNDNNDSKNYKVELEFKQTIRKNSGNGSITDGEQVSLGKKSFTFINTDGQISQVATENIPYYLTNKYPSQITDDEISKYLIQTSNVSGLNFIKESDDTKGTLTVNITAPYMWKNGELKTNENMSLVFGGENNPIFLKNNLANYDLSVTKVDKSYWEGESMDSELKDRLQLQYSTLLPSEVKNENYLRDFLILGSDFSNASLVNSGEVSPPTVNDITVTPFDREGSALIRVTIPKIGTQQNVVYQFETPNIFKKDASANESVYYMFKTDEEVRTTRFNDNKFQRTTPTVFTSLLNGYIAANQPDKIIEWLGYFGYFSNYFSNLIYERYSSTGNSTDPVINITTNTNLPVGSMTLTIRLKDPIEGIGNVISKTFVAFQASGSIINQESTFSWGNIDALKSRTPSSITLNDLNSNGAFVEGGSTSSLEKEVQINPINTTGSLEVIVSYKNFVQKKININNGQQTNELEIVPVKTFRNVYTGFQIRGNPVDVIIWKSESELDAQYRNKTPSELLTQISTNSDVDKLKIFTKASDELETFLTDPNNADKISLNFSGNDVNGTISIVGILTIDGVQRSISTTISGFNTNNNNFPIVMTNKESSTLTTLKQTKLPSEVTDSDLTMFYTVQNGNSLQKVISKSFDDVEGTLTVKVELINSSGSVSSVVGTSQETYSGFRTNVPVYSGTNWTIVSLSIIIPAVIMMIPISYIIFIKNRIDVKKFSKKLDDRLSEETKKKKVKNVKSIKDLLDM
ncbi:lipoprotein 17-related variable surface protein [Malacoplasma iowae]|uniref:Lipoprotein 17-related variable surface protein n=1 Tax=Malacoplasma iowae 695 TaxID=1048830 RepID=A0A6P1LHR1_MALIO|nr:lipoprotein 17-related variable surface protein [Malacoplasma iowae]QHG89941.1 lipoprotein 17-related variable surface protein [Malacoplasma iowae 695]WPL36331.1 lipoprotein 17-related variable surface protein [Malacoplasma iowae]VEU62152.1 Uncharacterised protein [Mycoplasmopsis fermentans]VEU70452.1 Uncharacterised protein [Malacoplasma iowae]